MATQHLKYIHTGIDLDTGDAISYGSLIAIADDAVTITLRTIDRSRSLTFQGTLAETTFLRRVMAGVEELIRPDPQRDPV